MEKVFFIAALLLVPLGTAAAQSAEVDLNTYYSYPVSAGVYYHQMSGIGNKALADFGINEISGEVRVTIPAIPELQPLLRGGYAGYTFTGDIDEVKQDWTHYHAFGGPGVAYTSRISREFEVGADIFCALSQSYFTNFVIDGVQQEPQGQLNLLAGLSARLALNPSYSFSISVNPTLNYLYGFGPLHDYDGFSFGVGFSGSYRFGEDPDAAGSSIRAIRFDNITLPPLFAAMQSYYVKNPAGTITVTNKEKYDLEDISLSFMQPGFMDSPSPMASGISLNAGESTEVPVYLTYNNEVFSTQGITPLTGEIIAVYTVRGRAIEQRTSVNYDLHDRNALTWNDDRKAAAFITAQDSAVRNYSSYIRQIHRDEVRPYVSSNLQFAIQAFNALGELGILYQIDPTAPFTEVQGDTLVVDSISLPRETLKRLTGDCDDLTVLYCTMLESIGIDTALVTVPGHIFSAFNTKVPSAQYRMVNPDRSQLIEIDGNIWLPVEITMIGKHSFIEAWSKGMAEYSEWDSNPARRGFYKTREAQTLYRPVVLRETDLGLQYGDDEAVVSAFENDLEKLSESILKPVKSEAEAKNTAAAWNSYGIAAAKLGEGRIAESAFNKAVSLKSDFINAKLNLGSLYFIDEKYDRALEQYSKIEKDTEKKRVSDRTLFNLYLNISKALYALNNTEQAGAYYNKAIMLDSEKASDFAYLGSSESTTRASDAVDDTVFFFE